MHGSIIEYRIFCITEGIWTHHLLHSPELPTTCSNNTGHTVNPDSVQVVEVTSNSEVFVKVKEESTPTGGNFRVEAFSFTVPANTTESLGISWKYPVSLLGTLFTDRVSYDGCVMNVISAENTVVGVLTAASVISSPVLTVSPTVLQYVMLGYEIKLGGEVIGEIIGVDFNASTITLDTDLETVYPVYTPVMMQIVNIKNYLLGSQDNKHTIGKKKIGGHYIPANVVSRLYFQNTTANDIIFKFELEYLF